MNHLQGHLKPASKMLFKPIPDRSKDITSINTLEFLLRKQARMIVCHSIRNYELCALWQVQIRNQKRNNQNFSAVIFHYLNSPLPFHQKALSLHRTIIHFSVITP